MVSCRLLFACFARYISETKRRPKRKDASYHVHLVHFRLVLDRHTRLPPPPLPTESLSLSGLNVILFLAVRWFTRDWRTRSKCVYTD